MTKFLSITSIFLFISLTNAQVIYVNQQATGSNDGTNWEDAYTDLQTALSNAEYGDEIWLAKGNYYPTNTTNRFISFELKNGVALYGGFDGTEQSKGERDWQNNLSILDGDIGNQNNIEDNSYTVLYLENCDSITVVDGLVVQNGRADFGGFWGDTANGAGIYVINKDSIYSSSPKFRNCLIQNNLASYWGGGALFNGEGAGGIKLDLFNCTFQGNGTSFGGGGLFKMGVTTFSSESIINNCSFINNGSSSGGGLMFSNGSNPGNLTISNSIFQGNYGAQSAGGLSYSESSSNENSNISIINCEFIQNYSGSRGAGILLTIADNTQLIQKCTFIQNNAGYGQTDDTGYTKGGAIFIEYLNEDLTPPTQNTNFINCNFQENKSDLGGAIFLSKIKANFFNCIFQENKAGIYGGAIYTFRLFNYFPNIIEFNNCTFLKNEAIEYGGAMFLEDYNTFEPPHFCLLYLNNSILWDNISENEGDGIVVKYSRVLINNSLIDAESCEDFVLEFNDLDLYCDSNNIYNIDPLFQGIEDYTLSCNSTAIDAGNNDLYDSEFLPYGDLLGAPRVNNDFIDIGAYEAPAPDTIDLISNITHASTPNTTDGQISILEIQGGSPPFQYEWENGDTTETIQNLSPGIYAVTLIDSNNCMHEFYFEVSFISNIAENGSNNSTYSIAPNPVLKGGQIRLFSNSNISKDLTISLFDSAGKLIKTKTNTGFNSNLDLLTAPHTSGIYFLKIEEKNTIVQYLRLVII